MRVLILLIFLFASHVNASSKVSSEFDTYSRILKEFESKNYLSAIERTKDLLMLYPFSDSAVRSEMIMAYSYFMLKEYDDAINSAERYLEYHYLNKDYIYYLIAVSKYKIMLVGNKNIDIIRDAEAACKKLQNLFPDSNYSLNIDRYLNAIHLLLVQRLSEIVDFYFEKDNCAAVKSRVEELRDVYNVNIESRIATYARSCR